MDPVLALLDVIALHDIVIERYGGAAGLRDEGALESALARPRMAAFYAEADVVTQAALVIGGIAAAHAFVDGNKRTALLTGMTFLSLQGCWIEAPPEEMGRQIEALVTRQDSLDAATARLVDWMRPRLRPEPDSGPKDD